MKTLPSVFFLRSSARTLLPPPPPSDAPAVSSPPPKMTISSTLKIAAARATCPTRNERSSCVCALSTTEPGSAIVTVQGRPPVAVSPSANGPAVLVSPVRCWSCKVRGGAAQRGAAALGAAAALAPPASAFFSVVRALTRPGFSTPPIGCADRLD